MRLSELYAEDGGEESYIISSFPGIPILKKLEIGIKQVYRFIFRNTAEQSLHNVQAHYDIGRSSHNVQAHYDIGRSSLSTTCITTSVGSSHRSALHLHNLQTSTMTSVVSSLTSLERSWMLSEENDSSPALLQIRLSFVWVGVAGL